MQVFKVDGMTCDHCERAVTNAVRGVDPAARVEIDLAAGIVRAESTVDPRRLAAAIRAEGYQAEAVTE